MSFSTISGTLIDSDTTPWINALWSAVAVSPSSPPVFSDGTAVLPVFGQLDSSANFSGSIPRTDTIQPAGTTLTITIYSVTSALPSIIENVVVTTPTINLGDLLSPRIQAPRIQAASLVYAYQDFEVMNPTHGNGYVNTTQNLAFIFVGDTWIPIDAGPLDQIFPPSGVAVSTGTSWAASIPQAVVARLDTAQTWTQVQAFTSASSISSAPVVCLQPNLGAGESTTLYVGQSTSAANSVYFAFINEGSAAANRGQIGFFGSAFATFDKDGSWSIAGNLDTGGALTSVHSSDGNLRVDPTAKVLLNWDSGTGVLFGNGAGGEVGAMSSAGTFTAVTKSFRIIHPLDKTKYLTHSTLEGPEIAVFYRGEGQTSDGTATITLPEYFEALTRPDGRTVHLTIKVDDADPIFGEQIAAGTVANGEFKVYSSEATTAFYWEVKAIRADVEPLQVEQAKAEPPPQPYN